MYRKTDLKLFAFCSIIANILVFAAFLLIILYHFYLGKIIFRQLAICSIILSVFMKFQIFMLRVSIVEIRVANLLDVGDRPSKLAFGSGILALVIYSILFWMTAVGILLSLLPAGWLPF